MQLRDADLLLLKDARAALDETADEAEAARGGRGAGARVSSRLRAGAPNSRAGLSKPVETLVSKSAPRETGVQIRTCFDSAPASSAQSPEPSDEP